MDDDPLAELQLWFARNARDRPAPPRIEIATLDNPGWSVQVHAAGTELEGRETWSHEDHRDEHNWLVARFDGSLFDAAGGPMNLSELIAAFTRWAIQER